MNAKSKGLFRIPGKRWACVKWKTLFIISPSKIPGRYNIRSESGSFKLQVNGFDEVKKFSEGY